MKRKQTWQESVTELEEHQRSTDKTTRELAEELNLSTGKVSTDLQLAAALRVYPDLEKIEKYVDAIKFIKKKKFRRSA